MARRTQGLGVDWHLPLASGKGFRKQRFASTTQASADLIVMLAESGMTWEHLRDEINFDSDAVAVADRFIAEGYGDTPAHTMLTMPRRPHPAFEVGDRALHTSGTLDSREVAEVAPDGRWVRLHLLASVSDWLPAANYRKVNR